MWDAPGAIGLRGSGQPSWPLDAGFVLVVDDDSDDDAEPDEVAGADDPDVSAGLDPSELLPLAGAVDALCFPDRESVE